MTLPELLADLQLKARCSIADVTPQWCAEAAACLEPLETQRRALVAAIERGRALSKHLASAPKSKPKKATR